MRACLIHIPILMVVTALAAAMANPPSEPQYTMDFGLEHCAKLLPKGENLYFPLEPGTFRRYEGLDDGESIELEITVLPQTKNVEFEVNGVTKKAKTRVVEEREWVDEVLIEVSRNYFAVCSKTGNVYYFGEDVDFYENGQVVSHEGSWLAGQGNAQPGLIMPSVFVLGARYFQELAPGQAMDRAKHTKMGIEIETPAGVFENCVKIVETTPLEPGAQSVKYYAPGIGLVVDDGVELVAYHD